jgi:aconitate hydratase
VGRSKAVAAQEKDRRTGKISEKLCKALSCVGDANALAQNTQFGSCLFANKPGDGSAREQAASCQKVLGGFANICYEFATKRYRSNCINWGILPFTLDANTPFPYTEGDFVFVPDIREKLINCEEKFDATVICADGSTHALTLYVKGLTNNERQIILDGCLMNYYANGNK